MNKQTHGDFTKYPKIFARAYWSAFQGEAKKEINDNRNDFVEEFGIKGHYKMPKYMYKRLEHLMDHNTKLKIDHIETYKTNDNECVIINSPYYVTQQDEEALLSNGYVKYKPLYTNDAVTFIYVTHIGRI